MAAAPDKSFTLAESKRERRWKLVQSALLVGLTGLLGCFELADYDFWWHLKTGELIPERGLPRTDWYSFTASDNAWIDVQWAFQCVLAWIYSRWQAAGVVCMVAGVAALAVAVALGAYRSEWPASVRTLLWLPTIMLLSSRFFPRPEIFTVLFLAIFLSVLLRAEERPALLWLLVPVQFIWANFHGLFIFGPILLAFYFAESILRLERNPGMFRHLVPVCLLSGLACVAGPYGVQNILLVLELWKKMGGKDGAIYRETVVELENLGIFIANGGYTNPYVIMIFILLALAALGLLVNGRELWRQRRFFSVAALAAFAWLGFQATRNGNHFAMVVGTITAWNLGAAAKDRRWFMSNWCNAGCVALIASAGLWVVSDEWYLATARNAAKASRQLGFQHRPGFASPEAMKLAGLPGMPDRAGVFHFGVAAEYIYHNGPDRKVYFDGRLEVYSEQAYRQYLDLEKKIRDRGNWQGELASLGVRLLIIDGENNHSMQATVLCDPYWRCIHYDETVAVFVHQSVELPKGVKPFDFVEMLFEQRREIFEAPLPLAASRPGWRPWPNPGLFPGRAHGLAHCGFGLGLILTAHGEAPLPLVQAVAWMTAQNADEAIRRRPWQSSGFRYLAGALDALHKSATRDMPLPAIDDPWEACTGLIPAIAIHALRQALACDPGSFAVNVVLHESYGRVGAVDLGLEALERLRNRLPANKFQRSFANQDLPKALATQSTKVANARAALEKMINEATEEVRDGRTQVAPDDDRFSGLLRYARAGLLGEGLSKLDMRQVPLLAPERADRVATWFLSIGMPEKAREVYTLHAEKSTQPTVDLELRLGWCAHAMGQYADARRHYLNACEQNPKLSDAFYGLALLSIMAGDRAGVEVYVARGLSAGPNERQRKALEQIAKMLERRR